MCHLQLLRSPFRRHRVEIPTDDEVGIVRQNCREVVVYALRAKLQFVKFLKTEVDTSIARGESRRGVCRVVDGARSRHGEHAIEAVVTLIILLHGEVERATNALSTSKLQVRPLAFVEEIGECALQIVKDSRVRPFDLSGVEGDGGIKFLRPHR